jgi:hypothetical protein
MEDQRDPATRHLGEHFFGIAVKQCAVSIVDGVTFAAG